MIFLREATQNDHIRLLHKFENDQKKFGCVGSCGYAPASVKKPHVTAQDPHYRLGYFDHFHRNFLKFVSPFAKHILRLYVETTNFSIKKAKRWLFTNELYIINK